MGGLWPSVDGIVDGVKSSMNSDLKKLLLLMETASAHYFRLGDYSLGVMCIDDKLKHVPSAP